MPATAEALPWRIDRLEAQTTALDTAFVTHAKTIADHDIKLAVETERGDNFEKVISSLESKFDKLLWALIGLCLTIAGSSVGLILTLGGGS